MPTKIDPDYQPSDRVYKLLAPLIGTEEMAREFVGHELGAFMLYWEGRTDKGAAKANWDSTCLNWMKRTYEDKKEYMARHRSHTKQSADVFQEVVGNMLACDLPKNGSRPRTAPRIQNTPIPGEGETMTTEEALDQLAKIGRTG